jgi:hypothetical protein
VTPELVTVDLTTVWTEGDAAVDATVTPWSLDLELGDLAPDVYDLWVRVDGETFLFTYFQVESARVAPGPLPDPVPTVTPRRRLGINLATLKDHSTMFTTVDVFKASRTWIPHRPSDDTWDTGLRLDLDTLGWVRSLQPDQEAGTLMMANLGSAYPGGRWEVLYDGQGELDVDWDARVIDAEPGRLVLWVTPEEGMHLVIRETDPDDYIRNIRVVTPGFEDADQLFHPTIHGLVRRQRAGEQRRRGR